MADIRYTPQLDDFTSFADENPISHGGKWQAYASNRPPMQKATTGGGTQRMCRSDTGASFLNCFSAWAATGPFDGDVEIWGERYEGGFLLGHNERLALTTDINPATGGDKNGYHLWLHQQTGSHRFVLYRVGGGTVELANVEADKTWISMRRNGNNVEVWGTDDPAGTWTKHIDVTDTTYTTGLYLVFGEGTNHSSDAALTGWISVGGGVEVDTFQQIIRRVIT